MRVWNFSLPTREDPAPVPSPHVGQVPIVAAGESPGAISLRPCGRPGGLSRPPPSGVAWPVASADQTERRWSRALDPGCPRMAPRMFPLTLWVVCCSETATAQSRKNSFLTESTRKSKGYMLSLCGWTGRCRKISFLSRPEKKVNGLKVSYSDAMLESIRSFHCWKRPAATSSDRTHSCQSPTACAGNPQVPMK